MRNELVANEIMYKNNYMYCYTVCMIHRKEKKLGIFMLDATVHVVFKIPYSTPHLASSY